MCTNAPEAYKNKIKMKTLAKNRYYITFSKLATIKEKQNKYQY